MVAVVAAFVLSPYLLGRHSDYPCLNNSPSCLSHGDNQKPDDGHEQCGQQIERLAVFQTQETQSAARNHEAAHQQRFRHQGIADGCGRETGDTIEHALPQEQHGSRQHHADAVGGGKDGARNEIEGGIGEKESVVAFQGGDDRTQHRQRADAIEEDGCR